MEENQDHYYTDGHKDGRTDAALPLGVLMDLIQDEELPSDLALHETGLTRILQNALHAIWFGLADDRLR